MPSSEPSRRLCGASRRHPRSTLKARHAGIRWRLVADPGNAPCHADDEIVYERIWKIARNDPLTASRPRSRPCCGRLIRTSERSALRSHAGSARPSPRRGGPPVAGTSRWSLSVQPGPGARRARAGAGASGATRDRDCDRRVHHAAEPVRPRWPAARPDPRATSILGSRKTLNCCPSSALLDLLDLQDEARRSSSVVPSFSPSPAR